MTYPAAVTYHTLHVFALGTPSPQGSKRAFGNVLVDVNRDRLHTWRDDVKQAALRALDEADAMGGFWDRDAVAVLGAFTFTMKRPRHHFVAGDPARELKDTAPRLHAQRPDLDKLLRSTWDALTASGAIRDDCRLAQVFATKVYVDPLGYKDATDPGVKIALTAVKP